MLKISYADDGIKQVGLAYAKDYQICGINVGEFSVWIPTVLQL